MPYWTILKIIHSHTPTRPVITVTMSVSTHIVNKELKASQKAADRNI